MKSLTAKITAMGITSFLTLGLGLLSPVSHAVSINGYAYTDVGEREIESAWHRHLNFGLNKSGSESGAVKIAWNSTITATGGAEHISGGHAGTIRIVGEKGQWVNISTDNNVTLVPVSGNGPNLSVDLDAPASVQLEADTGERNYVSIGGTMSMPGNLPADHYRGHFAISLDYQ